MNANAKRIGLLTVIYDSECEFCRRCRSWLESQPQLIALHFVARNTPGLDRALPGLETLKATIASQLPTDAAEHIDDQLVVVDDQNGVYLGDRAFLMCLYALKSYRSMARRLARTDLWPTARKVFMSISDNRRAFSGLLKMTSS